MNKIQIDLRPLMQAMNICLVECQESKCKGDENGFDKACYRLKLFHTNFLIMNGMAYKSNNRLYFHNQTIGMMNVVRLTMQAIDTITKAMGIENHTPTKNFLYEICLPFIAND